MTKRYRIALFIAVVLITFIVYLPALKNDFVNWDDYEYVVNNGHIRSLDWPSLRWIFTDITVDYWHPLSMLSHALDYAVWGLNPVGHHLTSIVMHAINTGLVLYLLSTLLHIAAMREHNSSTLNDDAILIASCVAGLLFGIHPLHVESVVWITERKDVLCGLFYLLSILSYIRFAQDTTCGQTQNRTPLNRYYVVSLVLFVLALSSKAMAVSMPFVLLILDWYPLERIRSRKDLAQAALNKLPYFVAGTIISVATFAAHQVSGDMSSLDALPLNVRVLTAFSSIILYLIKMILPLDLLPFYPYPADISLFRTEYLSAIAITLMISAAAVLSVRRGRVWITAWLYYLITLFPVLGLVQVSRSPMADRFTYLPSIGPFLVTGLAAAWLWEKAGVVDNRRMIKRLLILTTISVCIAMAVMTIRQISVWRNGLTLWSYIIEKRPDVPLSYMNRGLMYSMLDQHNQAAADFTSVLELEPFNADAYNHRGLSLESLGKLDDALKDYAMAISIQPSNGLFHRNRAIALTKEGRADEALEAFSRALQLKPGFADVYMDRGDLYRQTGNTARATEDYWQACVLGNQVGCDAAGR